MERTRRYRWKRPGRTRLSGKRLCCGREEKANLRALTAQLEPEQRELVLLRFAQQLKLREIAQITGLPLRTVQSRLRAALKTLKMQLDKEDWR